MFRTRLLFKTRCTSRMMSAKAISPFMPIWSRPFSTNIRGTQGEGETIIDDHNYYVPTKAIDISKGTFTVFNNKDVSAGLYTAPYEVKETMIKNSIGAVVMMVMENCFWTMYYIPPTLFALNMLYQVSSYMTRAVDKMVLLN